MLIIFINNLNDDNNSLTKYSFIDVLLLARFCYRICYFIIIGYKEKLKRDSSKCGVGMKRILIFNHLTVNINQFSYERFHIEILNVLPLISISFICSVFKNRMERPSVLILAFVPLQLRTVWNLTAP